MTENLTKTQVKALIIEAREAVGDKPDDRTWEEDLFLRLAEALAETERRRANAVSQRNLAYRQRNEERAAKEGNIRHLNAAVETIEKVRAWADAVSMHMGSRYSMPLSNLNALTAILSEASTEDPNGIVGDMEYDSLRDEWRPVPIPDERVERMCIVMHDAYEAAAQEVGWETQERSRKPWDSVPEANKQTMRVAVRTLIEAVRDEEAGR